MGPIALFDKSFLEGLNIDEAVLFDHFFYPVTCPIFYVETLADLQKAANRGRSPEDVVGAIAFKTPEMHGGPSVHHRTLVTSNLLGQPVPMTGQICVAGGIPVMVDGTANVVFKPTPEREAFDRWQRGQFQEIERRYAQRWREDLRTLQLSDVAQQAHNYGMELSRCKTIEHAKELAEQVIGNLSNANQIALAVEKFHISASERDEVMDKWERAGRLPLAEYAPYARFVLLIEIFFEMALATGKISADRPSNINDLAYLFYLPFCMVFLSTDRLHRACAPLFMRPDQQFLWGADVKADLRANHEALMQLPEADRLRGLIALNPPPVHGSLIHGVHERHLRPRPRLASPLERPNSSMQGELSRRVQRIAGAAKTAGLVGALPFRPDEVQGVTIERLLQKKRGSWYQVPHDTRPDS
jgi:hypothetical protein